ncbi:alpha-1,2-fucosyltransferase [Enterocloster bolteae]|uniref:alpha-1,2-fucosyltransferase n=1 Tax=Enterocloster bolteae TaxID=208479 RepID=UPI002A814395|nr:alpha-1,2-fucosyltransferase [Enterocloster bolteae]
MIIVGFGDGLGNQMFQYAFYKAMKKKYSNNDVKMDICYVYGPPVHNGFELDNIFSIQKNISGHYDAVKLADYFPKYMKRYYLPNKLQSMRRLLFGVKESYIHPDDPTEFYPEVFELNSLKSYYLRGNWINEKYFKDFKSELVKEFSFKKDLTLVNENYRKEMIRNNSVAIHLRRGDYLGTILKELNLDYYKRAIDIIERSIENPLYFIFSDNKMIAEKEFEFLEHKIIVEGNKDRYSYIDMQLMSCCKHNIIANSTFSFWGAYLNSNVNKIVIAPDKASERWNNAFACDDWILLEV